MPRNGNTTRRGYGHPHQATRAQLAPKVAAGRIPCWRCQRPIPPPPPGHQCRRGCRAPSCWDLGHDDHNRAITRGPEHRHRQPWGCPGNRSTGATLGNRARGHARTTRTPSQAPAPNTTPTLIDDDW